MVWHKINWNDRSTLPAQNGNYMCRVVMPGQDGKPKCFYRQLDYFNDFICKDVIVTHWTDDMPEPEGVQL